MAYASLSSSPFIPFVTSKFSGVRTSRYMDGGHSPTTVYLPRPFPFVCFKLSGIVMADNDESIESSSEALPAIRRQSRN